jgi:exonuclease III
MSHFSHTTARVAVWNLAGFHYISDEKFENQLEGLSILDAEIITLIEVKPFSYLQRLIDGLAAKGCDYRGIILQQTADLNIGVMVKSGVENEEPKFIEGSDLGNASRRKAFSVEMKVGKFDFLLIALHLKSGRGRAEQVERNGQCKVIGDFITEYRIQKPRKPVLLMGDFNMIPGQDVSNFHFLGGDDIMDFLSSWDLQARFSHILSKGRANLLDGFAITRTYTREYIRGSLRLFPMHWTMEMGREKFRKEVSDHLPFVASFRID